MCTFEWPLFSTNTAPAFRGGLWTLWAHKLDNKTGSEGNLKAAHRCHFTRRRESICVCTLTANSGARDSQQLPLSTSGATFPQQLAISGLGFCQLKIYIIICDYFQAPRLLGKERQIVNRIVAGLLCFMWARTRYICTSVQATAAHQARLHCRLHNLSLVAFSNERPGCWRTAT